jgi:hypothetical protein
MKKILIKIYKWFRYNYRKLFYDKSGINIILDIPKVIKNNFGSRDWHLTWEQIKAIKHRKSIGIIPMSVDAYGMKLRNHNQAPHHFNKKRHGFYLKKSRR